MKRHDPLDQRTADRLVAGELLPDDVPPGYGQVAALLSEAAAPSDGGSLGNGLLAAMVEAVDAGAERAEIVGLDRRSRIAKLVSTKVAVAGAAVILSASGAAAATGSLPDAAQDPIAAAALHIGLNLPDSASDQAEESTTKAKPASVETSDDEDHGTSGEEHGRSGEDHGKSDEDHGNDDDATTTDHGPEGTHGATVSEVAREDFTDGRQHGEDVSEVARTNSDANSNAEDPGASADHPNPANPANDDD